MSLSSHALSRRMVFQSELKISEQEMLCLVKEIEDILGFSKVKNNYINDFLFIKVRGFRFTVAAWKSLLLQVRKKE